MAAANTDKFKKAKRRFSTTIGVGGFTAGATTLPLSSTSGLDTDTAITLVIEPGTVNEEVITGVVSGSNIVNCVRGKEGTSDVTHTAGSAVSMYFTETHWDDLITGVLTQHNQDGTHGTVTSTSLKANPGTSSDDAVILDMATPTSGAAAQYDSHALRWRGARWTGSAANTVDWRLLVDVTAGGSQLFFQNREDSNSYVSKFTLGGDGVLTLTNRVQFGGPAQYPVTTKTGNYTATLTDYFIRVDTTSGNVTITLPTAVNYAGLSYIILKTVAANTVTVQGTSSQTLNGSSTQTITSQYGVLRVFSNDTNWNLW
jgi:hypothetical protein